MNKKNMVITGLGAIAGITMMKTMQNKGTQKKVKKVVNDAFHSMTDKVDDISNMDMDLN